MEKGGNMPAVLNAANEIAVQAFLDGKLSFNQISEVNEEMINQQAFISEPELENYFETTKKCFADTEAYISKHT
jgi:1-deoxy-D-xylulose-5-phosphate reductoisomerase